MHNAVLVITALAAYNLEQSLHISSLVSNICLLTALKLTVLVIGQLDGNFQVALEMWALHKILGNIFVNHGQQSHFLTVCLELFWQNLTSQPQKFSTEGHRAVIFHRK